MSDFEKEQLMLLQSKNAESAEQNLVQVVDAENSIDKGSPFQRVNSEYLKLLTRFLANGQKSDISLDEISELPFPEIDALFDRRKIRLVAKHSILNADKIEHLGEIGKIIKGSGWQAAVKTGLVLVSKAGPRIERSLVRQYLLVIAASYGFNPTTPRELEIRNAIAGKSSPLGMFYDEATRSRTMALNKVATATDKSNIDHCLIRIDDFYRERRLIAKQFSGFDS